MKVFITGSAGFIGFHLARRLLDEGHDVIGFDGVTDYYDVSLKRARLRELAGYDRFTDIEGRLEDAPVLLDAVVRAEAEVVVHLAAQAGVRYSLEQPASYIGANLVGTANLLEAVRASPPRHLLFASSSSVYGGNQRAPFSELHAADAPLSLYAATKKSGEAMVHAYSHLYGIPSTSLRFFTVYGPWGRPDMALFKFVAAILERRTIDIYGQGQMRRDFTYIDDLIEALMRLIGLQPARGEAVEGDSLSGVAPYRCVNLAGGHPEPLLDFVAAIEHALGMQAERRLLPMQPGDPRATAADTTLLRRLIGEVPRTEIVDGIAHFVDWYRHYYRL